MQWLELSVQVPSEFVEPVSYLFGRYGNGLSIQTADDGHALLRTYLTTTAKQKRARIEVGVKLVGHLGPIGELNVRQIAEVDWQEAWKKQFTLLRMGGSFVIRPPWTEYEPREGERVIVIDPGLAFGTGHHPTTRMVLEALEELCGPGTRVLDLGAGSGILSVGAAMLGAESVVAMDVDPVAVRVASKAIRANAARETVRLVHGTLPHSSVAAGCFDLALANISDRVIKDQAGELRRSLREGGALVAGGFLERQEAGVTARLRSEGFTITHRRNIEDWVTLVVVKGRKGAPFTLLSFG